MYDIVNSIAPWILVIIMPALAVVSIFFHLNLRTRSSFLLMSGFVIAGIGAIVGISFPREVSELIDIQSQADIAKVAIGDTIQRKISTNEAGPIIYLILYEIGFLITFFGFTSLTLRIIKNKNHSLSG